MSTPTKEAESEGGAVVVQRTSCCVVGGGPAGAVLSLLLARKGVPVMLLEAHDDFDRDFRGDTIHPSVLELLDEIGLAEPLHQLPHTKIHTGTVVTPEGPLTLGDFRRLKTRFPYIMILPQKDFLAFIVAEAARYPEFSIRMGARVEELIEEGGEVRGVRYEKDGETIEVRALLTVGADGRGSRVRRLGGFEQVKTSPPMDVVWFRLPREAGDPAGGFAYIGGGHSVVMLDRGDLWQVAYLIPKGSAGRVRAAGIEGLRETLAGLLPQFAGRVGFLKDWKQVAVLSVESSRVKQWYKPGLLLIGDAAHVMSPVGGVGINYAIQDAVVAANVLAGPLAAGEVRTEHLRAVQRQREWPTRLIQLLQTYIQKSLIAGVLDPTRPFKIPLILRIPGLRNLFPRVIGLGFRRVHVK